ncbi:MAG: hypothetical protein E7030_04500 [Akkermansiaceae bacterium]|nr:hypothetical protein [Akkermansiaceae bacterium]
MFKYIALTATVATGCICPQLHAADTIAASATMTEEEATAVVNEFVAFMNELTEALESVSDSASADAAAERLNILKLSAGQLQAKLDTISTLDPAIQQKLLPLVLGAVVEHGQRVSKVIESLQAADCYGSQALRECLAELRAQ